MKWNADKLLAAILLFFVLQLLPGCGNAGDGADGQVHKSGEIYTCPMHPEVISDRPGSCPKCKMDLVPLEQDSLLQVVSPSRQVLSSQRVVSPRSGGGLDTVSVQGMIAADPDRDIVISARYAGRVEKLYVKFASQRVRKGDRIMDIYSPSLRNLQEEHLFLLRSSDDTALVKSSGRRLRLLGLSEAQVDALEKNRRVAHTIAIYSPAEGYVFYNNAGVPPAAATAGKPQMNAMGGAPAAISEPAAANASSQEFIREGDYIAEGQEIFRLNDLSQTLAFLSVPVDLIGNLQPGAELRLKAEGTDRPLTGKLQFIEPVFGEQGQRFARARVLIKSPPAGLKVNSLVSANFTAAGPPGMRVPSSAVYHTGRNSYVWLKTGTTAAGTGIFELRRVLAGVNMNGWTEVRQGLAPGDMIAVQAGLMADSETFLSVE